MLIQDLVLLFVAGLVITYLIKYEVQIENNKKKKEKIN
jgi:hypothetical protein